MKNHFKVFLLVIISFAVTLFYQNCAKFTAKDSDSSAVLLQAYPNKDTLNADIASKAVTNTVVLDGQEIHQGPKPNVSYVTHDSGAIIYHSGAPVLNIPIVITLNPLKGEYFSAEALVKKAKEVSYFNCITLDGVEIYAGSDDTHIKSCLKLLSANGQAGGGSSTAGSSNQQLESSPGLSVGFPLTVSFSVLAGKYNSITEVQNKAKEIKFQNCISLGGKNIYFGFGPCVELLDTAGSVPASSGGGGSASASSASSSASVGSSTSSTVSSQVSSGLPTSSFSVASGVFAGSYSSVEALKNKAIELNFKSCVTLNGTYVYMGFGPCMALKSK